MTNFVQACDFPLFTVLCLPCPSRYFPHHPLPIRKIRSTMSYTSDLISDDLIFTGGGEECEMFIVSVKKQAFRAGKATDNAWSAQFAGTCFAGAALRWYEGLDDVTQNDWGLLRKALLARYPAAKSDSIISTPGSAPPAAAPPPTHPPSISELSLSSPAKLGRIRIYPDNAAAGAYVAKTLNTSGHFLSTSVLAQSLEVQVIPCKGPQNVVLMNLSGKHQNTFPLLGIKWESAKTAYGNEPDSWASFVATNREGTGTSSGSYSGPSRSAVWNIFLDGSMSVVWPAKKRETYSALDPVVRLKDGLIHVFGDYDTYSAKYKVGGDWTRVRFVFEQI